MNKKIAFVILNDPMIFPPTMNAAAILAENNYIVDVYCMKYDKGEEINIPKNVNIKYVTNLRKGIYFRLNFIYFTFYLLFNFICNQYRWACAYNMTSLFPAYLSCKLTNCKLHYHNHDDTIVKKRFSLYYFLKKIEYWVSRKSHLVSYPQKNRANDFKLNANLSFDPLIVKNGPRISWAKKNKKENKYEYLKKKYDKIIIYQGGLNWERGIKNILDIHAYLDSSVGLILIGKASNSKTFLSEFYEYIKKIMIEDRVVLLPVINYNKLSELTSICDLGFGVMIDNNETNSYNIKYLAGASNKLVEYMSCNVPSIVPQTKEYKEYIGSRGIGVLINPSDHYMSAKKISEILFDEKKLSKMKNKSKEVFIKSECYDIQFEKILTNYNQL